MAVSRARASWRSRTCINRALQSLGWIESHKEGVALLLHCQPGAKITRVVGEHDGRLKISLQAPAVENRANEVLIQWLADAVGVARRDIVILSGQTGRKKRLLIRGAEPVRIAAALVKANAT